MQILEPHPRSSESETLGVGPSDPCFTCLWGAGGPWPALGLEGLDLRGNQAAWVTEENDRPEENGLDVNPGEHVDTPSLSWV